MENTSIPYSRTHVRVTTTGSLHLNIRARTSSLPHALKSENFEREQHALTCTHAATTRQLSDELTV